MDQPRPARPRQPTDEPGWWLASDGKWYPPESSQAPPPSPVLESLPPIHWYAPGFEPAAPKIEATIGGAAVAAPASDSVAAPIRHTVESHDDRSRPWLNVVAAAALVLLIAAIGTVYATQRDDRGNKSVSATPEHSTPTTVTTAPTTSTTTTTTLPPPAPTQAPAIVAAPAPAAPAPYYENCTAVRAAGAAPIYRGQPGYAPHLDSNDDGVGCE